MDDKELRSMVREMLDAEDAGFSNWEMDFLDSVWQQTYPFSEKQRAKIEQMYERKM